MESIFFFGLGVLGITLVLCSIFALLERCRVRELRRIWDNREPCIDNTDHSCPACNVLQAQIVALQQKHARELTDARRKAEDFGRKINTLAHANAQLKHTIKKLKTQP